MRASDLFKPVNISGKNYSPENIEFSDCGKCAAENAQKFPLGNKVFWGIPFDCGGAFAYAKAGKGGVWLKIEPIKAKQLVFLHASETPKQEANADGIIPNLKGYPPLNVEVCDYTLRYANGATETFAARSRFEINDVDSGWGGNAALARPHLREKAGYDLTDDVHSGRKMENSWGYSQTRVIREEGFGWPNCFLYAFENPRPDVEVIELIITPKGGSVFLFAMAAGETETNPLRYGRRRKALLPLEGNENDPLSLVEIDLGHIISVTKQPLYAGDWINYLTNPEPGESDKYIVEFAAHDDAKLYFNGRSLRVSEIAGSPEVFVASAEKYVTVKVLDENGGKTPVRIHAHGKAGEYLPPRNRHRIPNAFWFEDYSVDLAHRKHFSTYIDGEAEYLLPLGEVFIEVSKGFEIKPARIKYNVTPETDEIIINLERVINWRARGWVTADTHVHFLSPHTSLLEGEAEGVNVVNLLASQWGELFTNIGDFTGEDKCEAGRGDYMVKVGTENRQQVMGHISLLGYTGKMILPLTTGGPDESALGDPMEITLTQWADQCKKQGGLSILPHFPNPRLENAAAIVSELIDAVEVTTGWGFGGINPYYLSDWYRYLNCGYKIAAVGGTDKMGAYIAIGEMRTYAKLLKDDLMTYDAWKRAVLAGRTFASCGALAELRVEGREAGETLKVNGPAKLTIEWSAASAALPLTCVELVRNGELIEKVAFDKLIGEQNGHFTIENFESAWYALRLRGKFPGSETEAIAAHTSAIFVIVDGKALFNAPDAATILDQIEGATAYVTTLGTKAQATQYKLAIAALEGAHRALHNRMHSQGMYHAHDGGHKHAGHENM